MPCIRGAIFDADGTLLDSMHIWDELGERYLRSLGIKAEEGLAQILFSMTLEESSAYLKKRYQLAQSEEEIKAGVLAQLEDFYRHKVSLKPGAADFLYKLAEENIPMVIATSGDKELLEAALERLNVAQYFRRIFTCSELKTSKKQPDIYRIAADFLGTAPKETAVFEDVLYAVETAKSAGFFTAAVEDAASISDKERLKQTADVYLENF